MSAPTAADAGGAGHIVGMNSSESTEIERLRADLARVSAQALALVEEDQAPPGDLVMRGAEVPAVTQKATLATARAAALHKANEVRDLQERLRAEMNRQMQAMRHEMDTVLTPLQAKIAQFEEGIWTVNLYLGRDEEITSLLDGDPAPAQEPLVIRQAVLSMDEETAAFPESEGIDYRNVDVFDEWITVPEHLAQVLPEPRGVVVLMPRARGRDYGDPWANVRGNEENTASYWLIRNGDRLWRMRTDIHVGGRLVPAADEFTRLFRARDRTGSWTDLVPGTPGWAQAEKAQDAQQRHFMRIALVLQGLVDRTGVWHPLPPAGLNLLHPATYAQGRAVLRTDAEALLTTKREPFYAWVKRLNAQLRPGMRIVGAFDTDAFARAGGEGRDGATYFPNKRIRPYSQAYNPSFYDATEAPPSHVIHRLQCWTTCRGERGLAFHYPRTQKKWMRDEWGRSERRAPKTRATAIILPGEDTFVLPFDLVTVEEMEMYLAARTERHAYTDMMPLLHAAVAAKRAEHAAEAPFRILLAAEIARSAEVDIADATAAVPALVDWWKLANRWHRPLVAGADLAAEAKAVRMISAEFAARVRAQAGAGHADTEAAMVARLRRQDPTIMFVGRRRGEGYLAFAPQPRRFGPRIVAEHVWVREYTTTTTGRTISTRDWVLPGTRSTRTRVLFGTEMWAAWHVAASANTELTDTELGEAVATVGETTLSLLRDGWPSRYRQTRNAPMSAAIIGITHDLANKSIEVYLLPEQASDGVDRVPSALAPHIFAHCIRVRIGWSKTAKAGVSFPEPCDWRVDRDVRWWDELTPWGRVYDGAERDPEPVETNDVVLARALDQREAVEAYNKSCTALASRVRDALSVIEANWLARAEREQYARFLDDYADPDLWEGHRKTLRITYPHSFLRRFDNRNPRGAAGLHRGLATLVDAGVDLTGWSVADVLDTAGAVLGETVTAPADLLDLLVAEPDAKI